MPSMTQLERDQFLSRVKPVNQTISDKEFAWYMANLPTNLEGSLADMRWNGTYGWVSGTGPGQGQEAQGDLLLSGAKAYWKAPDSSSNSRVIADANGKAWSLFSGGVVGTTPTTNDPLWLPYDGKQKYLYVPRSSSATQIMGVRTPNRAGLNLTNQIDVRVKVRRSNWNAANNEPFITKQSGLTYDLQMFSTSLQWYVSNNGSSWLPVLQIANPPLPVNQWIILRATVNGTARTIQWSNDNGASWTVLVQDTGFSGNFVNGTGPLEIGSAGPEGCNSAIAWAEVRAVVDGPIISRFDANLSAQSGYTSTYGDVWAIQRGPQPERFTALVTKSCYLLGVDDFFSTIDGTPFQYAPGQPFTVVSAHRYWTDSTSGTHFVGTGQPGAVAYVLWRWSGDQNLLWDVQGTALARCSQVHSTYGVRETIIGIRDPANTASRIFTNNVQGNPSAADPGDSRNANGLYVGAGPGNTNPGNIEWFGTAVFDSVLSTEAIAAVTVAMNA